MKVGLSQKPSMLLCQLSICSHRYHCESSFLALCNQWSTDSGLLHGSWQQPGISTVAVSAHTNLASAKAWGMNQRGLWEKNRPWRPFQTLEVQSSKYPIAQRRWGGCGWAACLGAKTVQAPGCCTSPCDPFW